MDDTLTVRDLIRPGEPLSQAEVLAGEGRLSNPVTWVVSLRPYPPALPQLRGGELALVAVEHLARLDPPPTMASVVRQLASLDAAGVAVRGEVDRYAVEAARQADLPLLRLPPATPLHDIEQAIMRECALSQARREISPPIDLSAWLDSLLSGDIMSNSQAQEAATRQGYDLAGSYVLAYLKPTDGGRDSLMRVAREVEGRLKKGEFAKGEAPIVRPHDDGVMVLLAPVAQRRLFKAVAELQLSCGISRERLLLQVAESLAEAQIADLASAHLHDGAPTYYDQLGADRLLLLLYQERPDELKGFVEETLGPLLRHDARSAVPLLPTVQAFVEHGGRLRETAAEIYVHRNTLAYRLDRAAEILGADLKQPRTRLAIELALRALPLLGT